MSGTVLSNSSVRQGRWGMTFIGELGDVGELTGAVTPRLKRICDVFTQSGIETRWSHRIIGRLWAIGELCDAMDSPDVLTALQQVATDDVEQTVRDAALALLQSD